MKTSELTAIGLTEEQATQVLAMNGKDIESAKAAKDKVIADLTSERDDYKERLETAETTLKGFEDIDPEKIQQELQTYKQKAEDAEKDFASLICPCVPAVCSSAPMWKTTGAGWSSLARMRATSTAARSWSIPLPERAPEKFQLAQTAGIFSGSRKVQSLYPPRETSTTLPCFTRMLQTTGLTPRRRHMANTGLQR
jgi:hypothetical protein